MGKVLAVANQKGGSGKTTTTRSLGAALAELGKRTLLVDMDPQGTLSEWCGLPLHLLERTVYQVLLGRLPLGDVVVSVEENLDLVPANIGLSAAELQLASVNRRENRLRDAIRLCKDDYDFVLIDCPPSFGLLSVNCLSAADSVLVPMTCDYCTLLGVSLMLDSVREIQAEVNVGLRVEGILPTRFDARTRHAKKILDQSKAVFGDDYKIYDIVVHESVRVKESPGSGKSILGFSGASREAMAYRDLAREIVNGHSL